MISPDGLTRRVQWGSILGWTNGLLILLKEDMTRLEEDREAGVKLGG